MDFDDHDDPDEEMTLPPPPTAPSSYDPSPPVNSSRVKADSANPNRKPAGSAGPGARYRECLKNHAVGIGGHAVDGCGEFMAAGEEGTLDALRCAACSCHRNFHRREPDPGAAADPATPAVPPFHGGHHQSFSPYYRTPAGYLHHHQTHQQALAAAAQPYRAAAPLALPSTSGGGASRGDEEEMSDPMAMGSGGGVGGSGSSSKKRFRTKFTQEQKDKMLAFAERVGWRIQKHDEAAVQQFCSETAVKRHVLKVWMHNNKHTLGKKP